MAHESNVIRIGKGRLVTLDIDHYVVVDLETTGFVSSVDKIIEFGAARVENGQIVETFSALANPGIPIPANISRITGITDALVSDAPPPAEILPSFLMFIGNDIIVGHNVAFDINFLYDLASESMGRPVPNDYINTCALARSIYPHLENHRLSTVSSYCGVKNEHAHRALSDVICTQQLYELFRPYIRAGSVMQAPTLFSGYGLREINSDFNRMLDDSENVAVKSTKNGISVYFYGKLAFSIRINSRSQVIETDDEAARPYLSQICSAYTSGEKIRFPLCASAEETDLMIQMISDVYANSRDSVICHRFLCCNDFVRCSDALQCLRLGDPDYVGCYYRKNLELGRIFYGKNRNA